MAPNQYYCDNLSPCIQTCFLTNQRYVTQPMRKELIGKIFRYAQRGMTPLTKGVKIGMKKDAAMRILRRADEITATPLTTEYAFNGRDSLATLFVDNKTDELTQISIEGFPFPYSKIELWDLPPHTKTAVREAEFVTLSYQVSKYLLLFKFYLPTRGIVSITLKK